MYLIGHGCTFHPCVEIDIHLQYRSGFGGFLASPLSTGISRNTHLLGPDGFQARRIFRRGVLLEWFEWFCTCLAPHQAVWPIATCIAQFGPNRRCTTMEQASDEQESLSYPVILSHPSVHDLQRLCQEFCKAYFSYQLYYIYNYTVSRLAKTVYGTTFFFLHLSTKC